MEERFEYDNMNRLTGVTLKRPSEQDLDCAVTYDALGRMTSKQSVTSVNGVPQVTSVFGNPTFDPSRVHAMASASITDGVFPPTAQAVTYTGFDKVRTVRQGNDSITYTYGFDHQRIRMEEHVGSRTRTKDYAGLCEFVTETDTAGTLSRSLTYLMGPFGVFAVVEQVNGTETTHYVLKDNLGSWTVVTDDQGNVEQELSYDAWGNLRNPDSWNGSFTGSPMFDRGFTGHKHLTHFGLINMNGRMYDPVMSSFLSVDRFIQNPLSAQGLNPYAYCMYNPLRYVDPTGWAPRPGGGNGPDNPPYVVIDGWTSGFMLSEITVTPDEDRPALF